MAIIGGLLVVLSLALGAVGGIMFGQWPRPNKIWITSIVFGVASLISGTSGAFIIHGVIHGALDWWCYFLIALIPSGGAWLTFAFCTDRLNGDHVFGNNPW